MDNFSPQELLPPTIGRLIDKEGFLKDIWVPVSGALAQQRKVETIANNVANINTPGYKRDKIIFKEYLTALDKGVESNLPQKEWSPGDFYHTHGAENSQVRVAGTYTDFTTGQLLPTGNVFDLGLKGKGFFEVLTKNGIRYTRTGKFSVSPEGRLVTQGGDPVLGRPDAVDAGNLGEPSQRVIVIPSGKFSVNREGEIFDNGRKVSRLSIVEFRDIHALKKEGNAYYANGNDGNILRTRGGSEVYQGFLEGSNVNAVTEMSDLIKAHRHFESIQNAIKAYDNMEGKAVNEISKF